MNIRITDDEGRVHFVEMVLCRTAKATAVNIAKRCFARRGSKIEWWELRFENAGAEPALIKRRAAVDNSLNVWFYDEGSEHGRIVGNLRQARK